MEWFDATVDAVQPAAVGAFHLTLRVPAEVARSYAVPGQFLQLKPAGLPEGFFALAQAPQAAARLEFLVKHGTPIAEALAALPAGAPLQVSKAQGRGFPLGRAKGRNLLLVATGTGLAPMRAVINTLRAERLDFGRVQLLFGVFTPAHFPWPGEYAAWEADRVEVRRIISEPTVGWEGPLGFVQRLLEAAPLDDTEAFLVGQREMVAEVRKLLTSRGLSPEQVHLNF